MLYKQFKDLKLSTLGLGCMRLPTVDGKDSDIDIPQAEKLVKLALDEGINYFDTAWMYHGGNSETVMGQILSQYPRDSYYLASKFPGFQAERGKDPAMIFEKQLEKCRTEYFDFYLFHNLCESNLDLYLDESVGIHRYLMEQKKAGRIRHLGFSTHGSLSTMKKFLDAYGEDLEFCQIQLNWLDWKLQNAKAKVELIRSYGIPVWVMEPVRGGRLVDLPQEDVEKLEALRPGVTTPEWAFRFLQSIDGVTMVLSGMSNEQQLTENIRTFSENKPLNQAQWNALMDLADKMIAKNQVPCTGCSYCIKECPMGIPIPEILKAYNDKATQVPQPGPDACVGCGKCRTMCPQGIQIPQIMEKYADLLK